MVKYYLDTCIWRDYFENRNDRFRPLGEWAFMVIRQIINQGSLIVYSDVLDGELRQVYSDEEMLAKFSVVPSKLRIDVKITRHQFCEGLVISKKLGIPLKDALHSILARDHGAVLITRDKHFYEFAEQLEIRKPEDLI